MRPSPPSPPPSPPVTSCYTRFVPSPIRAQYRQAKVSHITISRHTTVSHHTSPSHITSHHITISHHITMSCDITSHHHLTSGVQSSKSLYCRCRGARGKQTQTYILSCPGNTSDFSLQQYNYSVRPNLAQKCRQWVYSLCKYCFGDPGRDGGRPFVWIYDWQSILQFAR